MGGTKQTNRPEEDRKRSSCGARRVLVAEADTHVRSLIGDALRKDGCEVIEAEEGGKLLRRMGDGRVPPEISVDLIICGVQLPICGGVDVLEALREAGRTVPVILLTAFGDDETRAKVRRLRATCVDKPIAVEALLAAVRELLP